MVGYGSLGLQDRLDEAPEFGVEITIALLRKLGYQICGIPVFKSYGPTSKAVRLQLRTNGLMPIHDYNIRSAPKDCAGCRTIGAQEEDKAISARPITMALD